MSGACNCDSNWCRQNRRIFDLENRLAEVEAERDELLNSADALALDVAVQAGYTRDALARLAAVEALKDWPITASVPTSDSPWVRGYNAALRNVRAAARGEADRPGVPADLLRAVARWRESDGDVLYSKCPHCGTVLTVPDRQLVVCCNGFRVDRRHLKPAPEITGMGGEGDR